MYSISTPNLSNSSAAFFMPNNGASQYSIPLFCGRKTTILNFLLKAKLLAYIFLL
jgi:hypothetical protein